MIQFGLSTHLFHAHRLRPEHLEAIAAHGFTAVEIFATPTHVNYRSPQQVADLKRWLADLGLSAVSLHGPICDSFHGNVWGRPWSTATTNAGNRDHTLRETLAAIDMAAALGCARVVLHLGLPRGQPATASDNDPHSARRSVEHLVAPAAAAGVRLALEVIPNDLSTPAALVDLLDGDLELGAAGVCLDLGHAHLMEGVPDATEAVSGAIITTHLHDNDGREDQHLVPGDGTIDWPSALTALWKVGYAGPLMFEVADRGDPAAVLQQLVGARRRLQDILDELAAPFAFDIP